MAQPKPKQSIHELRDEASPKAVPPIGAIAPPTPGAPTTETPQPDRKGLIDRLRERDKPIVASGDPAHGPG